MNKMQLEETFLNFGEELSNNFITFKLINIEYDNVYKPNVVIEYMIKIPKYNLAFNYKFSIPFIIKEFTNNLKESIINRIKIDINQFIVKEIELDKLGE